MSENKKLNDMETENVSGGKDGYDPHGTFEYNGKTYPNEWYFVCENCGKLIEIHPERKCIWEDVDYETGKITKRYVCEMCWHKFI